MVQDGRGIVGMYAGVEGGGEYYHCLSMVPKKLVVYAGIGSIYGPGW